MEDKENDNIYIYEEESDLDQSGPNYSQSYDGDDSGQETSGDDGKAPKSPFLLMFKVLLNPIEGWKSVRRAAVTPEQAQQGCFYPLLALYAVSKFLTLLYAPALKLPDVLVDAVCSFVSFFFGYFCIVMLLKIVMPGESSKVFDTDFGKVFVIISLSTLCMFYALADALPMLWAVLIFLPLWTIYIVSRGTKFFRFPEHKQIFCTFILCLLIIGVPSALLWLFELIIPF